MNVYCAQEKRAKLRGSTAAVAIAAVLTAASPRVATAQQVIAPKAKIYLTNSLLYPFVQVYFRTLDQDRNPFVNLTIANIGIMVQGQSYDPQKGQYMVQTLSNRQEPIRAVLVLDATRSMADTFDDAREAAASFIDSKRAKDEVALLVVRDSRDGYEVASDFERDGSALGRRLGQIEPKGNKTRLYDTIAGAIQMCAGSAQGGTTTEDAEYIPSCSVLVFSDGRDDASAISRDDLNGRISQMAVPVPIYSFSRSKHLESLSTNSFGKYYDMRDAMKGVQDVHNVLRNDYVLIFRSYLKVDGAKHPMKLGIEYPSGTGKLIWDSADFEANRALDVGPIQERKKSLETRIRALPDGNPYSGDGAPSKGRTWWDRLLRRGNDSED